MLINKIKNNPNSAAASQSKRKATIMGDLKKSIYMQQQARNVEQLMTAGNYNDVASTSAKKKASDLMDTFQTKRLTATESLL